MVVGWHPDSDDDTERNIDNCVMIREIHAAVKVRNIEQATAA
jgi:hypothetical protein